MMVIISQAFQSKIIHFNYGSLYNAIYKINITKSFMYAKQSSTLGISKFHIETF